MNNGLLEKYKDGSSEVFIPTLNEGTIDAIKFNSKKNKIGFAEGFFDFSRKLKNFARKTNPIAPNQADLVNWVIYDRWTVAANTATPAQFKFFTAPIGQSSKTKTDTNLTQVSRLDDPQWANVVGIGFYITSNMIKVDIDSLLNGYYHEFWVSQKIYTEGPLQCFPSAAGLNGVAATTATTTTISNFSNGMPRTDNFFDCRLPAGLQLSGIVTDGLIGITILQGQTFHVDMNSPAGTFTTNSSGPGLNVMCFLYTILSRGVQ